MVRIKYTGPASTVQLQSAQALQGLVSKGGASVQSKTQTEVETIPRLTTKESISMKQQQSLEMVQVMLHVSIGTLFYLREFLPLPCFDDRDLKEAQREQKLSYREFINGKARSSGLGANPEVAFGRGKRGQPLKIIIRNSDPKADMILDILENGIFDALRKNLLEAIQFTILVDKDAPENVLESYTFSFKYTGGSGEMNSRLESLSIDSLGCVADMKSAQTARVGLETIVRRLITLSAFLPTLPNKRNLGIHLFYTEDCPPDYEPPGFTVAPKDIITYPFSENWKKESQSCGTMDSGWHIVGLKVTSLKWTGPDPEGSEALPKIPLQLEYKDTVQRTEDIGFVDERKALLGLRSGNSSFHEATQDITERQKLQMMIPTQRTSSHPDSQLIPTQPINPRVSVDTHGRDTLSTRQRVLLSQKTITRINEYLRLQTANFARDNDNQNTGLVRCQCGWDGEEPAMIECIFCHTRQHLLCYGFEKLSDTRLPDVHACYQCLLEPNETQLLQEMNSLVLLRRALRIILHEGFPSKTSIFTQKLHCNGQTIVQITDLLRKRDFLQPTPGYKAKGFLRKGLPKFNVSSSEDIQQKMKREILDPMAKIGHHYAQQVAEGSYEVLKPVTSHEQGSSYKADSHEKNISTNGYENDQETQTSNEGLVRTLDNRKSRKRKQLSENGNNKTYNSGDLGRNNDISSMQEELNSTSRGNKGEEIRLNTNTNDHITPQRNSSGGVLRRSSRKRRKISNYSRLIDVGADMSDDESIL